MAEFSIQHNTVLGPQATDVSASALLSHLGVTITGDFKAALRNEAEYYLWHGLVPGDDVGRLWIPALFRSADLPAAIQRRRERPYKDGRARTYLEAHDDVRVFHSELVSTIVAWSICSYCEIDHLPRDEQERRYRALATATGLKWTLWVFSGGKSTHAYIAYDKMLDPSDPIRLEIQKLLVVCLEGDTKITGAGRLMRLPGWDGSDRKQPIVHLDPTARFAPEDIRDRLLAYAHNLGIDDIESAYRDLQLAERLEQQAKHRGGGAAYEMLEHADLLRCDRGHIKDDDRELAYAMLDCGVSTIANGFISKPGAMADKRNVYLVPAGTLSGFKKGQRIAPACCSRPDKPAASVLSEQGERPRAWCHRCEHTVMEEVPLDIPADGVGFHVMELTAAPTPNSSGTWRMPPLPTASGAYLVTTPMGSGKSYQVKALLRDPSVETALVICPTISLCDDGATKFGAQLYSQHQGKIQVDDAWVVCVPSIRRVAIYKDKADGTRDYLKPDVVIFEEIEQAMDTLHSPPVMRHDGHDIRGVTYNRLSALCTHCLDGRGRVIALDANGSVRAAQDLKRLTGTNPIVLTAPKSARTMWTDIEENRCDDAADLLVALMAGARDPDHMGFVYCTSQKAALSIARMIRDAGRSVLPVHGRSTPVERETLKDVNQEWVSYDWVIYTDAAGSGISYDVHDRHVYVFAQVYPGLTWTKPTQGVARARRPLSITSWVEPKTFNWSTNRATVRKNLLRQAEETMAMTYGTDEKGHPDPAPKDSDLFESMVDHVWITRLRGRQVAEMYYRTRRDTYGVKVKDASVADAAERKEAMKAFNAARQTVQGEAVDSAEGAYRIDAEQAKLYEQAPSLTEEERAEEMAYETLNRFGRDDRELLDDTINRKGKLWRQLRGLVSVALVVHGEQEKLRKSEKLQVEVEGKDGKKRIYRAQASHQEARADELTHIIREAGIDLDGIVAPLALPDPGTWGALGVKIIKENGPFLHFTFEEKVSTIANHSIKETGAMVDTFYWSDESLKKKGFVEAIKKRAKERDYGILGIPTLPKDFRENPSRWLGLVLRQVGIKTKPVRVAPGVIDLDAGCLVKDYIKRIDKQKTAESEWKNEKRKAKKEGRKEVEALRPPSRERWRTVDVEALERLYRLVERANRKARGHRVVSPDELPVLRFNPNDDGLPDDFLEGLFLSPSPQVRSNQMSLPGTELAGQVAQV